MSEHDSRTRTMKDLFRKIIRTGGRLAPEDWPSPTILKRWLRRPAFVSGMESVLNSLRFRADFQLTCVSAECADQLSRVSIPEAVEKPERQLTALSSVIRLAHGRERFHATEQARKDRANSSENDDDDDDIYAENEHRFNIPDEERQACLERLRDAYEKSVKKCAICPIPGKSCNTHPDYTRKYGHCPFDENVKDKPPLESFNNASPEEPVESCIQPATS